jgi:hypothetical protein
MLTNLFKLSVIAAGMVNANSCVQKATLECINNAFPKNQKCSSTQIKASVVGVSGPDYGLYCEQDWVDALNDMLLNPNINMCADKNAISYLLAHVAA